MDAKEFWKSKVFWFNILGVIIIVANAFGFVDFQLGTEGNEIAMFVILGINLVLRYVTKVPIKF